MGGGKDPSVNVMQLNLRPERLQVAPLLCWVEVSLVPRETLGTLVAGWRVSLCQVDVVGGTGAETSNN